jgi:AraC family transcriptional regulator
MEGKTIPPATYAVFTHHGPITRLGETYGHIYGEWLPSSGYARTDGPEFELYDARFRHDAPDSEMDIYIPVAPKEG